MLLPSKAESVSFLGDEERAREAGTVARGVEGVPRASPSLGGEEGVGIHVGDKCLKAEESFSIVIVEEIPGNLFSALGWLLKVLGALRGVKKLGAISKGATTNILAIIP